MFTGIVEEVGRVRAVRVSPEGGTLEVETSLEGIGEGDSVAVNGVCLTAVRVAEGTVAFEVSPETLRRSNLGTLRPGDPVNLERSLRVGDRFGGHIVTGHVDFTSRILSFRPYGKHRLLKIEVPPDQRVFFAPKGSVAVDGISLTVNEVGEGYATFNVIPYTYENTNLRSRREGDLVNVEVDVIARYVVNFLKNQKRRGLEDLLEGL
jgi:riboflavin synthase